MPSTDGSTPDIAESFKTGAWKFTPEVVGVFPEHVRASVPFYDEIQDLVAQASDWLLPQDGVFADLGAATGITAARVIARHPERCIKVHLYDTEKPMLDAAEATLRDLPWGELHTHLHPIETPLLHKEADLTTALFTLQFLPLRERVAALRNARLCATETGALLVAEKVRPTDSRWAEIGNDVSHDYKASQGIPDKAIRAKARALRGVLQPYPSKTLTMMLDTTGWCSPEVLFRWHQWTVVGAFATPAGL